MGGTHKLRWAVTRIPSHHPTSSALLQRLQTWIVQRHNPNPVALLTSALTMRTQGGAAVALEDAYDDDLARAMAAGDPPERALLF